MNDLPAIDLTPLKRTVSDLPPRKLLKHLQGDDYVMEMDWSSLERMLNCDRAAYYALIEGRIPPPSAALVFGAALHSSLEELYLARVEKRNVSLEELVAKAEPHFIENPPPINEWRNFDRLVETLKRYLKEYQNETFDILYDHENNIPYVERSFALPLGELSVKKVMQFPTSTLVADSTDTTNLYIDKLYLVWTGIIDLIVEQGPNTWIVDHKTTSIAGPTYFKAFELSQQFIGYCWATQQLLSRPIIGAIANVIIGRAPTKTGIPIAFERQNIIFPTHRTTEWPQSILALCSDLIHRLETGIFPQRTSWCVGKYGICPYFDVCELPPEHRTVLLHTDKYTTNTWNPINENKNPHN